MPTAAPATATPHAERTEVTTPPEPAARTDATLLERGRVHPRLTLWQWLAGTSPDHPMREWHRPSPGRRGVRIDALLAVLLAGTMMMTERVNSAFVTEDGEALRSAPWAVVVIPALFFIAVLLRRVVPVPAMLLGIVAFLGGQFAPYGEYLFTQVGCFALIYSATAWTRHRTIITILNLSILVLFTMFGLLSAVSMSTMPQVTGPGIVFSFVFGIVINVLYVLAATVFGANEYRRARDAAQLARQNAELDARTAALEAERRVVAEQAVRLDRVEIARELHDVVAHHVSLMGLQAAAARRSLAKSPQHAESALLAIEDSARTAITELQLMLTTLRTHGESDGRADHEPEPVDAPSTLSIDQLPELIESLRAAELNVRYQVIGEPREVTAVVGFTTYRILQEALTNARKHGGDAVDVDVRLRYLADAVELDVTNGPPAGYVAGSAQTSAGGGRGIVGMRERAAAVGGELEAGPRTAGGFRVVARLPYGAPGAHRGHR